MLLEMPNSLTYESKYQQTSVNLSAQTQIGLLSRGESNRLELLQWFLHTKWQISKTHNSASKLARNIGFKVWSPLPKANRYQFGKRTSHDLDVLICMGFSAIWHIWSSGATRDI